MYHVYYQYKFSLTEKPPKDGGILRDRIISYYVLFNTWS